MTKNAGTGQKAAPSAGADDERAEAAYQVSPLKSGVTLFPPIAEADDEEARRVEAFRETYPHPITSGPNELDRTPAITGWMVWHPVHGVLGAEERHTGTDSMAIFMTLREAVSEACCFAEDDDEVVFIPVIIDSQRMARAGRDRAPRRALTVNPQRRSVA